MEDRVILDVMEDVFYPNEIPENLVLISQLKVFQGGGVQEGGYLEDIEGS